MSGQPSDVDRLLKARSEIEEELRRHKTPLVILFTDIVGSTSYFDRWGDTAGLSMLHRHTEMATQVISEFNGRVIKTIGDSVMAEFPEANAGVRAAVELQQRLFQFNQSLPERERVQLRIGIHLGTGYRRGNDVFGDAVNVAARITKRCRQGQILISRSVREAFGSDAGLRCNEHKITLRGKEEKEDVFEVIWTKSGVYADLLENLLDSVSRGEIISPARLEQFLAPRPEAARMGTTERPAPAGFSAALAGRYEVLQEIGRGGMGLVYRAQDRETGEHVALKVLRPEIASDPSAMERFKRELLLARKITHKNVCRIYEFNRADSTAYISMEFVEGESLRAVLSRFGGLPLRKGLQMVSQMCAGLGEAHRQGIVHRDLKPENVMLDHAGQVKLTDFGMAHLAEGTLSGKGIVIGTPGYMAPEQIQGRPVDERSDIYALGCILYEMFTGAPAFAGDTSAAIAQKQLHETPQRPRDREPTLPLSIDEAILKCMEKDAEKRFACVSELEAALGTKSTVRGAAREPAALSIFGRLRASRAALALGATGLVVILLGGLGLIFQRSKEHLLPPRERASASRLSSTKTAATAPKTGAAGTPTYPTAPKTGAAGTPTLAVPGPAKAAPEPLRAKAPDVATASTRRTFQKPVVAGLRQAAAETKKAIEAGPSSAGAAAAPKTIQVVCRHQLKDAKLTVSSGDAVIFQEELKGNKKSGFLGIKSSYSGQLSHSLKVPGGAHELSVRVFSPDGSINLSKKIVLPPPSSRSATLEILASRQRLTLGWRQAAAKAPAAVQP